MTQISRQIDGSNLKVTVCYLRSHVLCTDVFDKAHDASVVLETSRDKPGPSPHGDSLQTQFPAANMEESNNMGCCYVYFKLQIQFCEAVELCVCFPEIWTRRETELSGSWFEDMDHTHFSKVCTLLLLWETSPVRWWWW
ncbi:unnamed protein product [Pleuronectes platessa]|uniref:Uncharacterized protein n=1 Tax=Pleuronectes platessa TaxID=8262 RepID=A0A9N7UP98_PLEPL|nr:unnamed protein product [Pleuronectes platessa]